MQIEDVHGILLSPRNLSEYDFRLLLAHCCGGFKGMIRSIVTSDSTFDALKENGMVDSRSELKRNISSFSIGNRKLISANDTMAIDDFFDTGIDNVKWTSIRKGKKNCKIITAIKDPEWFSE